MEASGDTVATLVSINGEPVPANKSTVFAEGTYHLIYRATDNSGNSATCNIYLNVKGEETFYCFKKRVLKHSFVKLQSIE